MAGAAWGWTITRRPQHSCPVWWGPLNELSPPWTETWLSHTFSTDRPQLQVKIYLPAFTPQQNRRNANYLLPQRIRQDNGYVFSRAKGETMKRLVIWKSIYSPWVTTILYTISRDSPTLLLNLLNLHALKNKVSRFFTAEKAISKECRVKWLVLPALNQAPCSHSRDSHREPPCSTYPPMRKTGADSRPFKAKQSRWRPEIFFFQTLTNPSAAECWLQPTHPRCGRLQTRPPATAPTLSPPVGGV